MYQLPLFWGLYRGQASTSGRQASTLDSRVIKHRTKKMKKSIVSVNRNIKHDETLGELSRPRLLRDNSYRFVLSVETIQSVVLTADVCLFIFCK